MVFSSLPFLFLFLPLFFLIDRLLPAKARNLWLLAGSLVFYACGVWEHPLYLSLFAAAIPINWFCGRKIAAGKTKKAWLAAGLVYDLGMLLLFKYAAFFMTSLNGLFSMSLPVPQWELPIGISFYTFQICSYLIDVSRGTVPAEQSAVRLGTYLAMFPQLIAGPIVSYPQVAGRLRERTRDFGEFNLGLQDFTKGLAAKVILANRVGGLWSEAAKIGYESISTPLAWMALAAYTLQIYFDFLGYSLMAVGLGRMLGFSLPANFDRPYSSVSVSEFWRRWHITLGQWFRNYVYIPLGGNRKGAVRTVRNLLIVWLLTGLWHGAAWNFVLWGGVMFLLITAEKFGYGRFLNRHRALGHCYLLTVIPLSWALFALPDFGRLGAFYARLFPFFSSPEGAYAQDFLKYGKEYGVWLLLALLCCTRLPEKVFSCRFRRIPQILLAAAFWVSVWFLIRGLNDPFLYYQF